MKGTNHEKDFCRFYAVYPHKVAKGRAIRNWNALTKDMNEQESEVLTDSILVAIDLQKRYRKAKADAGEWTSDWPHPGTYISERRWEDDIGSFSEIKARQEDQPKACSGSGKFCTGKAVARGDSGWLCPWCFSEKHADMGLLRDGFRRHGLGRKEGETQEEYRRRLVRTALDAAARFGGRKGQMAQDSQREGSGSAERNQTGVS